jgi:hypothetical protein
MSSNAASTARAGRDLAVAELVKRGWTVKNTQVDRRPVLLAERGDRKRRLRVSTRRSGTWQTSTRNAHRQAPRELEDRLWLFVDLAGGEPKFYVVPEAWMVEDIYQHHQRYLGRHGGERKDSPGSTHHAIPEDRIVTWRDRWDLLPPDR